MKKKGEEEETSILEIPFSFNTAFLIEEINGRFYSRVERE